MNKNKLIFAIIWWIILLFIIFLVFSMKKSWDSNTNTNKWDFNIWIIWDDKTDFSHFIDDFKNIKTEYKNTKINVETFSDYEEYSYALSSSIIANSAPDIFVLNNNEKNTIFKNQVLWLNPEVFNPNDFRKKYKSVFTDDLIETYLDWEKEKEALYWIPVWYETLGIYYNLRYVKDSDISYLSWLNSVISKLKKQKPNFTPIWIWNWSTVYGASDIITQFFLLENGVNSIEDLVWTKLKEPLWTYLFYWDENWDNSYNSNFVELKTLWNDNLDLFSKWEIYMAVWYPRMINEIDKNWYSKNLLRASPFPHYFSWEWKTLLNYNYFVINKGTSNYNLWEDFLLYLSSEMWSRNYLNKFPYYLPSLLSLESDKLEEKIHGDYKVVLKDFYNNDYLLSSFDKWIKNIYDRDIISILDNSTNYETAFLKFRDKILCKTKKVFSLEELSKNCN